VFLGSLGDPASENGPHWRAPSTAAPSAPHLGGLMSGCGPGRRTTRSGYGCTPTRSTHPVAQPQSMKYHDWSNEGEC